jgi:putative ABC transport system permease protein
VSTVLRQIAAVTALNLRGLPQRLGSSLVIVIGIAGVVAVLISVLALSTGFRRTIAGSARADHVVVLSRGGETEAASNLPRSAVATILDAPNIRRDSAGHPIASADKLLVAAVAKKSDGKDAYITLRGVGLATAALRPEIRLIAGRWFRPAVHELVAGRAAQGRFAGLDVGDRVTLRGGEWTVVGTFESGGNSHESGLLADADTVVAAYQSSGFSSVVAQLATPDNFQLFKDALTGNPTLEVEVSREPDYVATVSRPIHRLLQLLAYSIGTIMAVGALFGALNTMYSAVSTRSTEIATLRALGFGSSALVVSVLVEALLLALLGAAFGAMLAYGLFNGNAISTIGGTAGGSQLVYQLTVTGELVFIGIALACLIGLAGGLLPAIRAARLPIVTALRAN